MESAKSHINDSDIKYLWRAILKMVDVINKLNEVSKCH